MNRAARVTLARYQKRHPAPVQGCVDKWTSLFRDVYGMSVLSALPATAYVFDSHTGTYYWRGL